MIENRIAKPLAVLGITAAVALALFLLPGQRTHSARVQGPLPQVRVTRGPGGLLIRTETLRWQGPAGITVVTLSTNTGAHTLPPRLQAALRQTLAAQQRLLTIAFGEQVLSGPSLVTPRSQPATGAAPLPPVPALLSRLPGRRIWL